ncbi:MAG: septum formation initiator family protein [Segetibacter sp.]|jgi:cell division protein FtsB|nr:septum formation initiator family protein [Segetibacter sp.]
MKKFSPYISPFKNKYFVSALVFVVWISFIDRNDLFTQYGRKQELKKLETSKNYYEAEITNTKKELQDLTNNSTVLEKIAREKFFLKRPNEDVFIIEDSSTAKTSTSSATTISKAD